MGKLSVILYITIAIALLFFLSLSPKRDPPLLKAPRRHGHGHRRLRLRSNFTFTSHDSRHRDPVAFDPVVADMERHREDKEWHQHHQQRIHSDKESESESESESEHSYSREDLDFDLDLDLDFEDYLNNEERFNVTNRLVLLFPRIDVDPTDGFLSHKELTVWHLKQAFKETLHRTHREMELHDTNHDGFVSFSDYHPPTWLNSSDNNNNNNSFGYDMGWWKEEHFSASDVNGDGLLNATEFTDFLHPADTKSPKLLLWLCKEEIRERDTDKDGKVNFNEFFHGLFDLVRNYDEEGHNSTHDLDDTTDTPAAKKLFNQLDKDGDGLLTDTELLPVIGKLHPSERYYAKQQADYVISQADSDKDGRLSLAEMIENPYVFYSTIFNDEDDYDHHDELR